jgi:hypothetical protein
MFELPPSPFVLEKERLGRGFLSDNPHAIRVPIRRPELLPFSPAPRERNFLSAEERLTIAKTTNQTPAQEVADAYGIAVSYVYKLRNRYRYPKGNRC